MPPIMRKMTAMFVFLLISFAAFSQTPNAAYQADFNKWQLERTKDLKENWLTLIGRFSLKEGENTFGSDAANRIELPASSCPAKGGAFIRTGNDVSVKAAPGVKLKVAGNPVSEMKLVSSPPDKRTLLELGSLRMMIMQRGNNAYLRVRDLKSPVVAQFKGIQNFPLNQAYTVTADFVPVSNQTLSLVDGYGDMQQEKVPGEVRFRLNGQDLKLTPISLPDGGLFLMFSDLTKKKDTYPAGRYLETAAPKNGKVVLDFNRAYSPMCAWTPYAACLLTPKQNQLPVEITAGEKYAGHH